MLATRLLLGSLMIVVVAGLAALDIAVSSPAADSAMHGGNAWWGWPTVLVIALLGALAALELSVILRRGGESPVTWWAVPVTVGLIVSPWVGHLLETRMTGAELLGVEMTSNLAVFPGCPTVFWLTGGFLGTCLAVMARKRTEGAIRAIASTTLVFTYAGLLGSYLVRIRGLDPGPGGALLLLYVIFVIKSCDIGAFLVGRKFGKTPLAPWLSPGKTVEGFAGGVALSCAFALLFWLAWERWGGPRFGTPHLTYVQALLFAVLMATIGHLGDLVESIFKRDLGVKDSGHVMPAFGGVLDILDSPWFAAPLAWWMLTLFGRMG